MQSRFLTAMAVAFSLTAVPQAQSKLAPQELERRIAALEAQNRQILQDLQAIKSALQGRGAPPPAGASSGPVVDFTMSIAGRPTKGSAAAKLVIVEFSDFQCPFCGRYSRETLPQVIKEFVESGKAQYVFRQDPIPSLHPDAMNAAKATECALDQGRFWEMHDRLFNNQQRLGVNQLLQYGEGLGINTSQYRACVSSETKAGRIAADKQEAARLGVTGTPFFFVGLNLGGGQVRLLRRFKGAADIGVFRAAVSAVEKN
jgi:protein-disulfide isomerase